MMIKEILSRTRHHNKPSQDHNGNQHKVLLNLKAVQIFEDWNLSRFSSQPTGLVRTTLCLMVQPYNTGHLAMHFVNVNFYVIKINLVNH